MADPADPRSPVATARAALVTSTEAVFTDIDGLTDDQAREPSLLPGWTRGHVLTHLARNADAMVNLLTWARTGDETPMYPSREQRNADIEAGSGRTASDLVADVHATHERMLADHRRHARGGVGQPGPARRSRRRGAGARHPAHPSGRGRGAPRRPQPRLHPGAPARGLRRADARRRHGRLLRRRRQAGDASWSATTTRAAGRSSPADPRCPGHRRHCWDGCSVAPTVSGCTADEPLPTLGAWR